MSDKQTAKTEGQWRVDYLDKHNQRVVSGPHFEIATCWHHSVGAIEQEMEGNARLIAAAPDLLKALKWARTCVRFPSDCHAAIVEAITKAEGVTNDAWFSN